MATTEVGSHYEAFRGALNLVFAAIAFVLGRSAKQFRLGWLVWIFLLSISFNLAIIYLWKYLPGFVLRAYYPEYAFQEFQWGSSIEDIMSLERPRGLFGNPNASMLMVNVIVLFIHLALRNGVLFIRSTPIALSILFLPIIMSIILGSRAEFLVSVLLMILNLRFFLSAILRALKTHLVIAVAGITLLIAGAGFWINQNDRLEASLKRIQGLTEVLDGGSSLNSSIYRPFLAYESFRNRFRHNPIFGTGISRANTPDFSEGTQYYHNDWFYILAISGIIGFLSMASIAIYLIKRLGWPAIIPFLLPGLVNTFVLNIPSFISYFGMAGLLIARIEVGSKGRLSVVDGSELVFFLNIAKRVVRSMRIRWKRLKERIAFLTGSYTPSPGVKVLPWPATGGLPGNPSFFSTKGRLFTPPEIVFKEVQEVCSHHFRIFSERAEDVTIEDVNRKGKIASILSGLPASRLNDYLPIDWHQDFYSGYRWNPHAFFQDIHPAPELGVEMKVPRELSRFQHIGLLRHVSPAGDGAHEFAMQVTDWIVANPYGTGVNWECTMDVAIRAINWIWGLRFFGSDLTTHKDFLALIGGSLRDHGRHIYAHLDYYGPENPTENHYLSGIAGLIYIGSACPDFPESDLWVLFGVQELVSEMDRQVLDDGVCQEASSSYHRLVAELFASCAAVLERIPLLRRSQLPDVDFLNHTVQPKLDTRKWIRINFSSQGQFLPGEFYSCLEAMGVFSQWITKPSGTIFQWGDNDSGRAHRLSPVGFGLDSISHGHLLSVLGHMLDRKDFQEVTPSELEEGDLVAGDLLMNKAQGWMSAARVDLSSGIAFFPCAGIVVLKNDDAWVGISCGSTGKNGNGGHGHNDKNSFELCIHGVDIIVDGGSPYYTSRPEERNRFRSTNAHSTVSIEGQEQNEWDFGSRGLFRLAEKARPELTVLENGQIVGRHYGFGATHTRTFEFFSNSLIIADELQTERPRTLIFNFHPDIECGQPRSDSGALHFDLTHQTRAIPPVRLSIRGVSTWRIQTGAYSEGYMRPLDNKLLSLTIDGPSCQSEFSW